ncbi:MAG: hypothetical protein COA57_10200 [Flavobacteriales bacterium]|nr:MAG: hypothetical protein COA57_10200 [Flavobacteriales bacterium]
MKQITTLFFGLVLSFASVAQTGNFTYDGVLRDYILHVPSSYNGSTAVPLVLNLHGYTSDALAQQGYSEFDQVADTAGFIVVYPNGIANQWNSGFNVPYNSGTDDVGFLSALIDTISANYNIDANRVFSTGMSNGGYMSYRLACELDNKIAAIASVTGSMTPGQVQNCTALRNVPVLQVHGTADPTVLYNGTAWSLSVDSLINYWKSRNNCPSSAVVTNIPDIDPTDNCTATNYYYGLCDNSSEVVLFKIDGGEHTWPGAPVDIGITNHDFSASGEIWDFFYKHPMSTSPSNISDYSNTNGEVKYYPNPFSNSFTIELDNSKIERLEILNVLGEQMLSVNQPNANILTFNSIHFPKGIYLVKIWGEGGTQVTKIIKQ